MVRAWIRLALVALAPSVSGLHATFGRAQSMQLCRRWATPSHAVESNTLVRARLALEDPKAFAILATDDDRICAFVCVGVGSDVHRVDAVVWPDRKRRTQRFDDLQTWHACEFPEQCLVPGKLEADELQAWGEVTHEF